MVYDHKIKYLGRFYPAGVSVKEEDKPKAINNALPVEEETKQPVKRSKQNTKNK